MAGTLLHIAIADAAVRRADLSDSARHAVRAFPDDFHLGAVLIDLPYFERLIRNGLRLFFTDRLEYSIWGHLLHIRAPSDFSRSLMTAAKSPAGLALALGTLTHLAVDLVFHPYIEAEVLKRADGTKDLSTLHKKIEDATDHTCYLELLGHAGVGTPYAADALNLTPTGAWELRFHEACLQIHGSAPKAPRLRSWLKSLRLFGLLNRSERFPWTRTDRDMVASHRDAALSLLEQALGLATDYLSAGDAYLEKNLDVFQYLDKVPNRNLTNGTRAEPPRHTYDAS